MSGRRLVGLPSEVEATRGGVRWQLDLQEGIDLSIYLLGRFEPLTQRLLRRLVKAGDTVIDIGANIGALTLPFAQIVGRDGQVIAYEPTAFAYRKLLLNIALNPDLAPRVTTRQIMLMADRESEPPPAVFSSWQLVDPGDVHEKHLGRLMPTTGAMSTALDHDVRELGITNVDLLKLDVDGYEYEVLSGSREILERDRPRVLMEFAPYLFNDNPRDLDRILQLFDDMGYLLQDANSGEVLPATSQAIRAFIPDGASRNLLCQARA